jgi:hypothetical protein
MTIMTSTPHDTFAKNYLKELLSPLGEVTIGREIIDEPNKIDVLFLPSFPGTLPPESIGLLGRLAIQTSAIEVFRNQPNPYEVRNCFKKLYMYFSELNREADNKKISLDEKTLGKLWIISTTASQSLLDGFGATLDSEVSCQGFYSFDKDWKGSIIAVNQLPVTDETLWLRVLGKGKVQRTAVDELLALPDTNPAYKQNTLRMLANLRIVIIKQTNLSDEDREDVMQLSTAYLEWEQKTLKQGREEGRQEGRQEGGQLEAQKLVKRLLKRQVGEIENYLIKQVEALPIEVLEELSEALLDFSTVANLEEWLKARPIAQR